MRRYRPRRDRLPAWSWLGIAGAGVAAAALAMSVPVGTARNLKGASADRAPAAPEADTVRVIDGDTFDLDGKRVRVWGIDAPDKPKAMKNTARKRAAAIIASEGLTCSTGYAANVALRAKKACPSTMSSYGRINAQCTLTKTGEDFGNRMIREGFAVSYRRYDCGEYAELMSKAKLTRSGLWRRYPSQMDALASLRATNGSPKQ